MAGPVIGFQSHTGDGTDDINMGDSGFDILGWAILIIPIIQTLNRAKKWIGANVSVYGGILMEGGLHFCAFARACTINVMLNDLPDGVVFPDISRCSWHVCLRNLIEVYWLVYYNSLKMQPKKEAQLSLLFVFNQPIAVAKWCLVRYLPE
jgi:hypothetical protein